MNDDNPKREFVEKAETFFETQHLPRMAGRLLGWLLICVPPVQSAKEIGETLQMSKGSVSTIARQLRQMGLIEKVAQIGARGDFYRIHPNATESMLLARQAEFERLYDLSIQGLNQLEDESPQDRQRLLAVKRMSAMAVAEMTRLIDQIHEAEGETARSASEK
ncbi:predicted transcriptional regulator [Longilinea arvoryzae]|uniref:Predicted transcriptional regulator n=1 Tax=Longilinea arvoryzae TaxID=360412 RepID=A0A0S7BD64_9CHLR|nr:MarR family transcriptional regulator [Longilinea arvoryzae]GAP15678.1 predicted transcriptional regulator [Longilinea arvoryzae]